MASLKDSIEKSKDALESIKAIHGKEVAAISALFLELQNNARVAFTVWGSASDSDSWDKVCKTFLDHREGILALFIEACTKHITREQTLEVAKIVMNRTIDNDKAFDASVTKKHG